MSNIGGMQRVAAELHEALHSVGGISLYSHVMRSSFMWSHVRIAPFMAGTLRKVSRMVERREVDMVLFSSMVTASLTVALRRKMDDAGVLAASIVHGLDVTMPLRPYQRFVPRVFDSLDIVLPVSRATAVACEERGLDSRRSIVIPNGIDVARFPAPPGSRTGRRALLQELPSDGWTLRDSDFVLLSVGRQVRRKGFAWFIENVMPLLPENVQYWIAGDGPEHENIQNAVASRRLHRRVRLLGRTSDADLSRLYRGADLFVMPNVPVEGDMEGFGVVMLEAGLAGLPVVASRLEGIRDVIADGENGHFAESGDAWGFSEAIADYVYDASGLEAASQRAYSHVRRNFGLDAVARRYVGVLQEQLNPVIPREASVI